MAIEQAVILFAACSIAFMQWLDEDEAPRRPRSRHSRAVKNSQVKAATAAVAATDPRPKRARAAGFARK